MKIRNVPFLMQYYSLILKELPLILVCCFFKYVEKRLEEILAEYRMTTMVYVTTTAHLKTITKYLGAIQMEKKGENAT